MATMLHSWEKSKIKQNGKFAEKLEKINQICTQNLQGKNNYTRWIV